MLVVLAVTHLAFSEDGRLESHQVSAAIRDSDASDYSAQKSGRDDSCLTVNTDARPDVTSLTMISG